MAARIIDLLGGLCACVVGLWAWGHVLGLL